MPKEWSYELLCSDCDVIAIITIEPDLELPTDIDEPKLKYCPFCGTLYSVDWCEVIDIREINGRKPVMRSLFSGIKNVL